MSSVIQFAFWKMEFPERLAALRKGRGLTQQALADKVGVHVVQIRRYEGAVTQPTLEVLKKLTVALQVSADALLFDDRERGPNEALRLQFEAISALPADEQDVARAVLDAMILKNQVTGAVARATKPAAKKAHERKAAR